MASHGPADVVTTPAHVEVGGEDLRGVLCQLSSEEPGWETGWGLFFKDHQLLGSCGESGICKLTVMTSGLEGQIRGRTPLGEESKGPSVPCFTLDGLSKEVVFMNVRENCTTRTWLL